MSFSKNMSAAMLERKITNYRLAKEVGVHQGTIKNWLDGMSPNLDHAKRVADYFGRTLDEMMR